MCLPLQVQESPVHCHMPDCQNLVGLSQFVGELSVQLCTQAKKIFLLQLQLLWLHTSINPPNAVSVYIRSKITARVRRERIYTLAKAT